MYVYAFLRMYPVLRTAIYDVPCMVISYVLLDIKSFQFPSLWNPKKGGKKEHIKVDGWIKGRGRICKLCQKCGTELHSAINIITIVLFVEKTYLQGIYFPFAK